MAADWSPDTVLIPADLEMAALSPDGPVADMYYSALSEEHYHQHDQRQALRRAARERWEDVAHASWLGISETFNGACALRTAQIRLVEVD